MTLNNPHISIVLPVRNGARYLKATLESLFQQTYQDFSIHVLENCSEDATPEILRASSDARLQVFPATEPLSIEANWKRILELPINGWMTIISHDDLLYPTFLEEMVRLIEAEPDASLYTSHFNMIDAEGQLIRQCLLMPYHESGDEFLQSRHMWQTDSFGTGYMMLAEDYRQVGGIPPYPGLYYADDVLWANLANIKGRVCSPKVLYAYRYYRSSSARRIDLLGLYRASITYLNYLKTRPYFDDERRLATASAYVSRHLNRNYQRLLVNLISERKSEDMKNYQVTKAQLQSLAAQDQRFPVYNGVLAIIEKVAWIPFHAGRVAVLYLMEKFAILMRRFTD